MVLGFKILFLATLTLKATTSYADDVPCIPVATNYSGYVCMCNETYCDTIEAPTVLPSGSFYHYFTSNDNPGFTKTSGTFSDTNKYAPTGADDDSNDVYVWVNPSITYQTFKGLGVAITDTSGTLINSLGAGAKANLLESFYGPSGLEYNLLRLPVASTDYSPSYYTQDDVDGDVELKYFNLTTQDLQIKIPFVKEIQAVSRRGVNIISSPWSAPSWMKTTKSYFQGYVHNKYLEPWAKYLVKWLQAYKDEGVDIWALTIGNEVILPLYFGLSFPMGSTIMLPAQQRYWVKKFLGPMLQEAGFGDVKLYALDDERPFLKWQSDRLFTDKEFSKYIEGVALHWYFDWNITTHMLDDFHKSYPDKSIIYIESCINDAQSDNPSDVVDLGNWRDAAWYIYNVFTNLCHWSETFVDWTLALNRQGGPVGLDGFFIDAEVIINTTSNAFYKQPIFYSLGHFSKFITPGAQRVNIKIKQTTNDDFDEECSAASQEETKRKTYQKRSSDNKSILQDLPTRAPDAPSTAIRALAVLNPDGSRTVIAYNPRTEAANLTVIDSVRGTFSRSIGPYSINSFIYW